jgi:tyrosyl-tRNA synthetase
VGFVVQKLPFRGLVVLAGRTLVKSFLNKDKFVMTVPLLTDSNGNKIGKSEGNVIGITDEPSDLFGKIMTLADSAIIPCFTLVTTLSLEKIAENAKRLEDGENPIKLKKELAFQIVSELHSEEDAKKAQGSFETTFQKGELTGVDMPQAAVPKTDLQIEDLLFETKLAASKSDAKRLVEQNAVEVNDETKKSREVVKIKSGDIIKVGKRKFLKFS